MSTETDAPNAAPPSACTLVTRRVVGARGPVTGGHVWGAERRIAVTSGELRLMRELAAGLLVVDLSLSGPVSGRVNHGGSGYGLHFTWELPAGDFLEVTPAGPPRLREDALFRDATRGQTACHRGGFLCLEAQRSLEVPSLTGRSYAVDRRESLTIELSPDFRHVGVVKVRETSSPWLIVLPLNVLVVRIPFPRIVSLTDATLLLEQTANASMG